MVVRHTLHLFTFQHDRLSDHEHVALALPAKHGGTLCSDELHFRETRSFVELYFPRLLTSTVLLLRHYDEEHCIIIFLIELNEIGTGDQLGHSRSMFLSCTQWELEPISRENIVCERAKAE